jgi:hypothetical protein
MPTRQLVSWLAAGLVAAGCGGSSGAPGSPGGTSPEAGPVPTGTPGSDSGTPPPPTPDGAAPVEAGPPPPPSSAVLGAIDLRTGGRHASDLVFDVQGSDPTGQTTELHVRLLDASNNPVAAFDTNWNGVADSAEQRLHFDGSTLGKKTFTQTVTLTGLYRNFPAVASAVVSLSDINGALSTSLQATLTEQAVAALGAGCDVTEIMSRCAEGLACGGTPPTCLAGVAPSLTQVAYYGGGSQSTEIFVGADPDEDLQTLVLQFLDAHGSPISVDLSGDGVSTPVSSYLLDARSGVGQSFVFQNNPAAGFASLVPEILVTPEDVMGRKGTSVTVTVAPQVIRPAGQACDAYGINGCATGTVCSPRIVGAANTCSSVATLQSTVCKAAPQVATAGLLAAWGQASGVSLWDPPSGCAVATAVGRPESVVLLTLPKPVGTLTVSTAAPETDFDTVLYILPGCAVSTSSALGCADDSPNQGFASTVKLTDVAAGTYTIVVDSAGPQGGHFGLTVTTQ